MPGEAPWFTRFSTDLFGVPNALGPMRPPDPAEGESNERVEQMFRDVRSMLHSKTNFIQCLCLNQCFLATLEIQGKGVAVRNLTLLCFGMDWMGPGTGPGAKVLAGASIHVADGGSPLKVRIELYEFGLA